MCVVVCRIMAPKRHAHPEPQNVTLFGKGIFADVVIRILRSMAGVLIRERRRRFEAQRRRAYEIQRQRLE